MSTTEPPESGPPAATGSLQVGAGIHVRMDPMAPEHTNAVPVWRHQLVTLRQDCEAIKRRSRSLPILVSLTTFCALAAGNAALNLYIYDHTSPRPSHHIWVVYLIGLCIFATLAVVLAVVSVMKRNEKDADWLLVLTRIDTLNS